MLPFGILTTSALVALGILVFEPSFIDRSFAEVAQRVASESAETSKPAAADVGHSSHEVAQRAANEPTEIDPDCSDAPETDYACHQRRYQRLVHESGVTAAFDELKDEYEKNGFVRSNCHQLTHVIGRAAADLYGDISGTYGRGDPFCMGGYYHGAMESVVAKIGPDKILDEANTLCADLREHPRYSNYHFDCVHGLGHGFMGILENELFESLETCDTLTDGWERENCYGGVFMENVMAEGNPSHPPKYLKADQPLYPCTDVQTKYKDLCYQVQISYALQEQDNDFARVFDLCARFETGFRPACYQGLGRDTAWQGIGRSIAEVADLWFTSQLCMLGGDYEARSHCVVGAVKYLIDHYRGDAQAKALCGSFDGDLREVCLQVSGGSDERPQPKSFGVEQDVPKASGQHGAVLPKVMDQRLDQVYGGGQRAGAVQGLEEGVSRFETGGVPFDETGQNFVKGKNRSETGEILFDEVYGADPGYGQVGYADSGW